MLRRSNEKLRSEKGGWQGAGHGMMHKLRRIAIAFSGGLVLLAMSACSTASRASPPVSSALSAADLPPGDTIPPGYWNDNAQSTALTSYLDKNRLPMVGARVFTDRGGNRRAILYGFVATDFGKQDAAAKARHYLGDPALPVINRIIVRPELLASGDSNAPPSPSPSVPLSSSSYSDAELGSVEDYQSQAQQAQSQSAFSAVVQVLLLMSFFL